PRWLRKLAGYGHLLPIADWEKGKIRKGVRTFQPSSRSTRVEGAAFLAADEAVEHVEAPERRLIGAMDGESPADAPRYVAHLGALFGELLLVFFAQALGLPRRIAQGAGHLMEFDAALIGERLFRRIADLVQMTGNACPRNGA